MPPLVLEKLDLPKFKQENIAVSSITSSSANLSQPPDDSVHKMVGNVPRPSQKLTSAAPLSYALRHSKLLYARNDYCTKFSQLEYSRKQ